MRPPQPGNKYIIGWLTLRPTASAEFDAAIGPYVAGCRLETECRFFEMIRTPQDPLTVLVCECFLNEEAHAAHLRKPHFLDFWEKLHGLATTGRFENVIAGVITPDGYDFTTRRPIPQYAGGSGS